MTIPDEIRERVRELYGRCCGYCGVHESDAGSKLEIDHFKPQAFYGTDELENLVYCCAACNKFKRDFWPADPVASNPRRLLHPLKDSLQEHLTENEAGQLIALSETGAFHIEKLRLNRPQLLASRQKRRLEKEVYVEIAEAVARSKHLEISERELTEVLNKALVRLERLQSE